MSAAVRWFIIGLWLGWGVSLAHAQLPIPCDQACLQTALNAGGRVTIPPGTYALVHKAITSNRAAALRITKAHTHLDCQPGARFIMDTRVAAAGHVRGFVWIDPVDDVTISGCTFDGLMTATNSTYEDWMGVIVDRSTNVLLDRLTVVNLHGDGIYSFASPKNTVIRDIVLRKIVGQGISGHGWDGLLIDNADIAEGIHAWGGAEAMILRGRDIEVRGGRVRDFGVVAGVVVENFRVKDIFIEMNGRTTQQSIAPSGGLGCGGQGQYCRRARFENVFVDGSKVTAGTSIPIRIGGEASDVVIENATVIRSPIIGGNGIDVVHDGAPKKGIHIKGGTIKGAVPGGNLVRASVAVVGPASQFEDITVEGVTNEATTGCIAVVGVRGVAVRNNQCMSGGITVAGLPATTTAPAVPSEAPEISGNHIYDPLSFAEPGESGRVSLTVLQAVKCSVTDNYVNTGATAGGLYVRNSTDCLVQGNRVAVLAPRAHLIENGSDRNRWLDNVLYGTGPATAGFGVGSVVREAK